MDTGKVTKFKQVSSNSMYLYIILQSVIKEEESSEGTDLCFGWGWGEGMEREGREGGGIRESDPIILSSSTVAENWES